MKKLLIVLLALGTISFVPSAEARRHDKSCRKKESRPKRCEPKCHKTIQKKRFKKPCKIWVEAEGEREHETVIETKICTEETTKCVGGCEATCENAVE